MAINIIVQGDMKDALTGQCLEIIRQVRQKTGCPLNPCALKRQLQKIIEGNFPEWPDYVRGEEIWDKYIVLRFDTFESQNQYFTCAVELMRKEMDRLGVVPAEPTELEYLIKMRGTEPISRSGLVLNNILAIGIGAVVYGMIVSEFKDGKRQPYITKEYIQDNDWLECCEEPSNFPGWTSKKVKIHRKYRDTLGPNLWFLCKRKTTIG